MPEEELHHSRACRPPRTRTLPTSHLHLTRPRGHPFPQTPRTAILSSPQTSTQTRWSTRVRRQLPVFRLGRGFFGGEQSLKGWSADIILGNPLRGSLPFTRDVSQPWRRLAPPFARAYAKHQRPTSLSYLTLLLFVNHARWRQCRPHQITHPLATPQTRTLLA